MDEIKAALREDIVIGILFFVFLFAAIFGGVNWNNHIQPDMPIKGELVSESEFASRMARYESASARVGQDAVIPWIWAVPMCLVGIAGAVFFSGVLVSRHPPA